MITAHLPSGYCLAKLKGWHGAVFAAAIVGAVFPDLDLLFFYFVDDRAVHHHRYWVHIPGFWAAIAVVISPLAWRTRMRPVVIAFLAGIVVHLLLDSISGGIMWLAPFDTTLWKLVTVQPTQSHWMLSFILHWTFLLEVVVWILAGYLFLRKRRLGAAS